MITTYRDLANPRCQHRDHERSAITPAMGWSRCRITCPFCGQVTTAYVWSLMGGGKRCPCGALHDGHGRTHKLITPEAPP